MGVEPFDKIEAVGDNSCVISTCTSCGEVITDIERDHMDGICHYCCEELTLHYGYEPIGCEKCEYQKCKTIYK